MMMDKELIKDMIDNGKRVDGRSLTDQRTVHVETGVVTSAAGSARVRIGNTDVLAGVKIETLSPFEDTPDEGVLMVAGEFIPFASADFEPGPPKAEAIELGRVVDRAIRESKCIDFKKLCITPKEKVWAIYVDIDILNHDGSLIDASSLAAAAALATAKMTDVDKEGNPVYDHPGTKPLPMTGIPISVTLAKIRDNILVDATAFEEYAMDARLTVGTVDKDGEIMLVSMQKGGTEGLTEVDISKMIDLAIEKGQHMRSMVKK